MAKFTKEQSDRINELGELLDGINRRLIEELSQTLKPEPEPGQYFLDTRTIKFGRGGWVVKFKNRIKSNLHDYYSVHCEHSCYSFAIPPKIFEEFFIRCTCTGEPL